MKEKLREYLRELTQLNGVSGHEEAVVRYIKEKIEPFADRLEIDPHGNVIAVKKGASPGPKLMLAAHSDEIGFCVKSISASGFLYFDKIGTASDKVMEGRKVWVKDKIPGIIGIKPGHLQTPDEARTVKTTKQCYVDVGAFSKAEAEKMGIRIGDPIAYESSYMEMANRDLVCTKAIDNRLNCALLIALFESLSGAKFAGEIYAVFTVQEEIGMRGAVMTGNLIRPDYAIVLDTIPAGDCPDVNTEKDLPIRLGKGPACALASGVMVGIAFSFAHPRIREMFEEQAEKCGVNIQFLTLMGDMYATDQERLNLASTGIPTATLAVPRRYSHSPVELVNLNDAVDALSVIRKIVLDNGNKKITFI